MTSEQQPTNTLDWHIQQRQEAYDELATPIAAVNPVSGIITYVNPQAIAEFGVVEEDLIGHHVTDLLTSQSSSDLRKLIKQTLKASRDFTSHKAADEITLPEVQITAENGRTRWLQIRPKRLKDKKPSAGFIIELTDITRRKQLEALNEANQHLSESLMVDDVLNRIRDNLNSVIPHDSANIMLFDADEKDLRIKFKWGYANGTRIHLVEQEHSNAVDISNKPLLSEMLTSGKPVLVKDTQKESKYLRSEGKTRSYLAAPITSDGKVIGFLNLNSYWQDFYTEQDKSLLEQFANQITIALKNARIQEENLQLAMNDPLTRTRRREVILGDVGPKEMAMALRLGQKHPLSVVMFDIDRFKIFNDQYGHLVGDEVLRMIGKDSNNQLRIYDTLGRYGGEEFLATLPETIISDALTVAEKLRAATAQMKIATKAGELSVNISLGLAIADPREDANFMDLVEKADQAMLAVKAVGGRNAVGVYIPRQYDQEGKPARNYDLVAVYRKLGEERWEIKTFKVEENTETVQINSLAPEKRVIQYSQTESFVVNPTNSWPNGDMEFVIHEENGNNLKFLYRKNEAFLIDSTSQDLISALKILYPPPASQ